MEGSGAVAGSEGPARAAASFGPRLLAIVAVAAGLQVALVAAGLGGLPCPLASATGVPCPGCGMSRAIVALLRGDWAEMLRLHALAPLLVLAGASAAIVAVLPESRRARVLRALSVLESRRIVPLAALLLLCTYWLARLASGWRG